MVHQEQQELLEQLEQVVTSGVSVQVPGSSEGTSGVNGIAGTSGFLGTSGTSEQRITGVGTISSGTSGVNGSQWLDSGTA
jgi:hypothetical protein